MKTRSVALILVLSVALLAAPHFAWAEGGASESNAYYYDNVHATRLDSGYSHESRIEEGDPHYGWKLGKFVISGFTSRTQDDAPVFLKNAGDQIKLSFILNQDIDALNNDANIVIWADGNGYDEYFGIPKTDFGRGMLIVKQTDYQNASGEPTLYANYLHGLVVGAETEVDLFEEGDYEVALDYEIRRPGLFGVIPDYHNYKMFLKFKVRNSNTMMFLFDTDTGEELLNGSATANGFRIDMAQSHYLEVSVKKEVLNEARDGLVEDTRFNQSASDGSEFKDPGIYTITTRNPNTNDEPTTKVIYVGDDDLLKASVHNGISVSDVQAQLNRGATVDAAGNIVQASVDADNQNTSQSVDSVESQNAMGLDSNHVATEDTMLPFGVRPVFALLLVAAVAVVILRTLKGGANYEEDAS